MDRIINPELEAQAPPAGDIIENAIPHTSPSDAVLLLNPAGKVIMQNPNGDALMRSVASHSAFRDKFIELCNDPLLAVEPTLVQHHGCVYSVQATPVRKRDGSLLGYVMVFRDITLSMQA